MNILFWGTGRYASMWMIHNSALLQSTSYRFIERNLTKTDFWGKQIIKPDEIKQFDYDYLCILSSAFEAIKKDAIEKYNVEEKRILSANELETKLFLANKQNVTVNILLRHIAQSKPEIEPMNDYCDYTYIKKTYQNYVDNWVYNAEPKHDVANKIVWVCWFQGYEDTPPIVKACINSIKKNMGNSYEIRLVTENNLENYIQFPDHIKEKYKKGLISKTHFSDLLRVELLVTYGGIWMDATVLLTSPIPAIIQDSELFLFRFPNARGRLIEPRIAASWFIVSKPHNKILMLVRDLCYQYWHDYDFLINYFLFHQFFRMASEKFSEEWDQVIWHVGGNTNTLSWILFQPYDEQRYKYYTKLDFCQKLSYKIEIPKEIDGTFYAKILDEYLPK